MPGGPPAYPLVDRLAEMQVLHAEFAQVMRSGQGGAVVLVGESGIGKSRLVTELLVEAGQAGVGVLPAQCIGRGGEPLLPVREALAARLGTSPERIRRSLLSASPWLLDFIPFVGTFLGRLGEEVVAGNKLGGSGTHGLYEGLSRVLLGLAEKKGLVLAVEDVHAADPDTLYFLNYLLQKARPARLLTVMTVQEEQMSAEPLAELLGKWRRQGHRTVVVPPLPTTHVGEFIAVVAQGGPVTAPAAEQAFRLTGGNPFLLQETVGWFNRPGAAPDVAGGQHAGPVGLEAVLRHRLEPVDEDTRAFLDAAAVALETTQELEPVAYALDIQEARAIVLLNRACRLRLMNEGADGQISYRHDLTRQVVYRALGARHRSFLHGRAGQWHEQQERFAPAAHHFERAGQTAQMVHAALQAAEHAEHAGMFYSALLHYQKAQPHTEFAQIGPRLGRAHLVLGQWPEVERVLSRLPEGSTPARLLRSELLFVRGDFAGAAEQARQALQDTPGSALDALVRLADIHLYLGEFTLAEQYARRAEQAAGQQGSPTDRLRCLGIVGATQLFGGAVEAAEVSFGQALELLLAQPPDQRDKTAQAVLLGNLATVREAHADWPAALDHHRSALRLRREVFDARGLLHSLHGVARASFALGHTQAGHAHLDEASRLAADLAEPLEHAKIRHTRAELALRNGRCQDAITLAEQALAAFQDCGTSYDITHVQLSLAGMHRACGNFRHAVELAAAARTQVEAKGFGLLARLYPRLTVPAADRIAAALTAYACADAYGLPWEGQPPTRVDLTAAAQLPTRPGWEPGATSDDTALTLLVAEHLTDHTPPQPHELLRAFGAAEIPGLGPTTTAAIDHYRQTGNPPTSGGNTNGALMRALPVGWATPTAAADRRRRWALDLSAATHPGPEAQCAAAVAAACASWAVDGAPPQLLLTVAADEATSAVRATGADPAIINGIRTVAAGHWTPPADGISLHPYPTLLATLHCVRTGISLRDAVERAVALGGDTDTVAALTAGLLGALSTPDQIRQELPWASRVQLPPDADIRGLAAQLAARRTDADG